MTTDKITPALNVKGGGAKGGTRYPKDNLEKCVGYAKKLVSKTHIGPQPENIILNGVFNSSSVIGKVRLSSTRQFGLLMGDVKGYTATELAKKINSTPIEERKQYLVEAFFLPKIFKTLHSTFVNDQVNDSKLKQQILKLDVHPDNAEECIRIFKESIVYAGLAIKLDDDKLQINSINLEEKDNHEIKDDIENEVENEEESIQSFKPLPPNNINKSSGGVSNINVNIDVDPSMDPEKLEKLLKLLKSYGAI